MSKSWKCKNVNIKNIDIAQVDKRILPGNQKTSASSFSQLYYLYKKTIGNQDIVDQNVQENAEDLADFFFFFFELPSKKYHSR